MINFDEEIKKFHKSLEITEVEKAVYNVDMRDMVDVMLKTAKESVYGTEKTPGMRG